MIVDAHHHLWNLDREKRPWMTDEHAAIRRTFEPVDLEPLLVQAGIDATVLVQSACTDSDTDYLFERASERSWIGAVIAWIDLRSPERASASTRRAPAAAEAAGRPPPDPRRARPALDPAGRRCSRAWPCWRSERLILELPCVFPRHLGDVPELASSLPGLTIVIDHLAKPPLRDDGLPRWEAAAARRSSAPERCDEDLGFEYALRYG